MLQGEERSLVFAGVAYTYSSIHASHTFFACTALYVTFKKRKGNDKSKFKTKDNNMIERMKERKKGQKGKGRKRCLSWRSSHPYKELSNY